MRPTSALCVVLCLAGACSDDVGAQLDALALQAETRAALQRLRFAPLRKGDRLDRGDAVLCGAEDRAVLAFSRREMVGYLGIDAEFLIPELFFEQTDSEVLLEVPPAQLMRLAIPPGIGKKATHPPARVREVAGTPRWTGDLKIIDLLFDDNEIFARRITGASSAAVQKPRHLGFYAFPRMGPRSGVVVREVLPDSPAARGGLRSGDRIIAIDGTTVLDIRELQRAVQANRAPSVAAKVKRARTGKLELLLLPFADEKAQRINP